MAPRTAKDGTSVRDPKGKAAPVDATVRPPSRSRSTSARPAQPTGTARTVIERLGHVVGEKRREVACIGVMMTSVFTLTALVGWNEQDETWLRPVLTPPGSPEHVSGDAFGVGANLADVLYVAFGYGAYVPVMLGIVLPIFVLARRRFLSVPQWLVSVWLWVMLLATTELAVGTPDPVTWSAGGELGAFVADALVGVVGTVGAWIALVATVLTAASVVAGVSWSSVARAAVHRVEEAMPAVREQARLAGGTGFAWTKALVFGAARLLVNAFAWVGRWVLGGVAALGRWLRSLVERARTSLTRRDEGALDDTAWRELSGFERPESSVRSSIELLELPADATDADVTVPFADIAWSPDDDDVAELFTSARRRNTDPDATGRITPPATEVRPSITTEPPSRARPVPVTVAPRVVARPARAPAPLVHGVTHGVGHGVTHGVSAVAVLEDDDLPPPSAFDLGDDGDEEDDDVSADVALRHARKAALEDVDDDDDGDDDDASEDAPRARPITVPPPRPVQAPAARLDPAPRADLQVEKVPGLEVRARDDGRSVSDHGSLFFELPALSLLDPVPVQRAEIDEDELAELATTVEEALASFRVTGKVTNVRVGPVVTIFEFQPDPGIKVRRVSNLADDLALALRAKSVRVVAPIPGKGVVGIEIPSKHRMTIYLRELLASDEFRKSDDVALPVVLGKDTEGRPVVDDLAKMPHLLVGGTTGSGKSVGVNGMLLSLLYTRTPEELRLLLIDPKKLEFEAYNGIPHLLHPVITEAQGASAALAWACREMDRRYELLARWSTRSISSFNKRLEKERRSWNVDKAWSFAPKDWGHHEPPPAPEPLPYIVIVIDELADLMMVAKKDVQDSVVRLAQMARACGMHLVVATQRPSVDVVTGLIKSNLPTRISFKLRSVIDSRTILDQGGAEKLLGRGDMLLLPGAGEVRRVHGPFVSDEEVVRVIDFVRAQREPDYVEGITRDPNEVGGHGGDPDALFDDPEVQDELYDQALDIVIEKGKASTSMIQRHLKIGYNRAARILDAMEAAGAVGPADGARPRDVLVGPH